MNISDVQVSVKGNNIMSLSVDQPVATAPKAPQAPAAPATEQAPVSKPSFRGAEAPKGPETAAPTVAPAATDAPKAPVATAPEQGKKLNLYA